MSKLPEGHREDWSGDCKALFRAVRADHAPSALDRERVRRALARRISGNTPDLPVSATLTRIGSTLTRLAKLGIGLTLAAATTFVVQRFTDDRELQARPSVAQTRAPQPATAASPPAPSAYTTTAQSVSVAQTSGDTESSQPARPARSESSRRARGRVATAQSRGSTVRALRVGEAATSEVSRTEESMRVGGDTNAHSAGRQQSPADLSVAATDSAQAHTLQRTRAAPVEALPAGSQRRAEQPKAQPTAASAEDRANEPAPLSVATTAEPQEPISDPRAELSFIRNIQAALVTADAAGVLDLCSEHARRWPHGTFVQEREGLRTLALCESAARDASAHARQFLKQYPRTPLRARVRSACKL